MSRPTSLGCEHTVEKIKVKPRAHTHASRHPSAGPWDPLPPAEGRHVLVALETGRRGAGQGQTHVPRRPAPRPVLPLGLRSSTPQGSCLCLTAGSALGSGWGCSPSPSAAMHRRPLCPAPAPSPAPGGGGGAEADTGWSSLAGGCMLAPRASVQSGAGLTLSRPGRTPDSPAVGIQVLLTVPCAPGLSRGRDPAKPRPCPREDPHSLGASRGG